MAFSRVQGARHSAETRKWNYGQMKEALLDPRSWLLFLLCVFTTLPGGGLTAVCSRLLSSACSIFPFGPCHQLIRSTANQTSLQFGSVVLNSFGYSVLQTQLLTMSQGAFLLLFVVFTVVVSMSFKNARCISIALLNFISLAGALMIKLLPESQKLGRLGGLWLVSAFSSAFPTILSLVSSNITGHTKKSTVNSMVFVGFCVGYIIGPLTFLSQEAPTYQVRLQRVTFSVKFNINPY